MRRVVLIVFCFCWLNSLHAQETNLLANKPINYKMLLDEPADLNKLWLHAQPIMADGGSSNLVLGFSLKGDYRINSKFEVTGNFRSSYGKNMDFAKSNAIEQSKIYLRESKRETMENAQINTFKAFYSIEAGGIYHIKDIERKGNSKIVLTSKDPKVLQNTIPDHIAVDSKIRHVYSARLGAQSYATTLNLNKAIEKQGKSLAGSDGSTLNKDRSTRSNDGWESGDARANLFSSVQSTGLYLGGQFSHIKNHAIKADKFGILANSAIFSTYLDVLIAPWTTLDDLKIRRSNSTEVITYEVSPLKVSKVGWRAGFEFKYNEEAYMSFGGEIGMRPTVAGRGFYTMARIGIPVYSFRPKHERLANAVGPNQSVSE